jgi:hypothetical protein
LFFEIQDLTHFALKLSFMPGSPKYRLAPPYWAFLLLSNALLTQRSCCTDVQKEGFEVVWTYPAEQRFQQSPG